MSVLVKLVKMVKQKIKELTNGDDTLIIREWIEKSLGLIRNDHVVHRQMTGKGDWLLVIVKNYQK